MTALGLALLALPLGAFGWAYLGYPAVLWLWRRGRRPDPPPEPASWPVVSVSLPAYNEEEQIAGALDHLLAVDYPAGSLQILVVSDASSDRTDEIVRGYADRGVELLRLEERTGKTGAENLAAPHLRGGIVVNTDASIRVLPGSIKPLVRALEDETVGVASGRDVSVGESRDATQGEGGYVGYEMWVRSLESATGSIVGASGCFYATRSALHLPPEPAGLSRDFASVLRARERGFRSVHVPDAVCLVPRTHSLRREMRRKARTMARGLDTLWHHRTLLDPFRYGGFAIKLFSHKLCRWLGFLLAPLAIVGLLLLAIGSQPARVVLFVALAVAAYGWGGLIGDEERRLVGLQRLAAFGVATFWAGWNAWIQALRGDRAATWEPTRRRKIDARTGGGDLQETPGSSDT